MPEYVKKELDRLQNYKPKRRQYDPHFWTVPDYGKILQTEPYTDERDILDNKGTKKIQSIIDTMLYYVW